MNYSQNLKRARRWVDLFSLAAFCFVLAVVAFAAISPDVTVAELCGGGGVLAMMLPKRRDRDRHFSLQLASAALLGTKVKRNIERSNPLESIDVIIDVTAGGTAPATFTADGLTKLVKEIIITDNNGRPVPKVQYSGPGLLEYQQNFGQGLDSGSLSTILTIAGGAVISNKYRLTYHIPLVPTAVTEPLRTNCLWPVHIHTQDPTIQIEFSTAAEMYAAGSLSAVTAEIVYNRREITEAATLHIQKERGGFIKSDLIETPFTIGTGVSGEQKFDIPIPGQYANLLIRQYKGGAAVTRGDVSETVTIGSETEWKLVVANTVQQTWVPKDLMIENERTQIGGTAVATVFPRFGGALPANQQYDEANTMALDFLTDVGLHAANEFGGLLDCNLPADRGFKAQIQFRCASAATNGHTVYVGGHRFHEDLRLWQAMRRAGVMP